MLLHSPFLFMSMFLAVNFHIVQRMFSELEKFVAVSKTGAFAYVHIARCVLAFSDDFRETHGAHVCWLVSYPVAHLVSLFQDSEFFFCIGFQKNSDWRCASK